jgi:heme oxygenase
VTKADYARLLRIMLEFHTSVHIALEDARWTDEWAAIGIDLRDHDRRGALAADLAKLGEDAPVGRAVAFPVADFAAALGALYVVEGSSLGGRFIAPELESALGPIPLAYYSGAGRAHPRPWRSVQAALAAFDSAGGDRDAVVAGAQDAFAFLTDCARDQDWATV